jgi:hypothetical protein
MLLHVLVSSKPTMCRDMEPLPYTHQSPRDFLASHQTVSKQASSFRLAAKNNNQTFAMDIIVFKTGIEIECGKLYKISWGRSESWW